MLLTDTRKDGQTDGQTHKVIAINPWRGLIKAVSHWRLSFGDQLGAVDRGKCNFLTTTRLLGEHPTTFVLSARGLAEFWKNTTEFEKPSNGAIGRGVITGLVVRWPHT